jgi:hypothetical protein
MITFNKLHRHRKLRRPADWQLVWRFSTLRNQFMQIPGAVKRQVNPKKQLAHDRM